MPANLRRLGGRVSALVTQTHFYETFNFKDERAKGRALILMASMLTTLILNMVGGVFFSGFLLAANMDMVKVGTLSSIPYFMSVVTLLTPFVLGRMARRKKALCLSRLLYYFFNVLVITFIPIIFKNQNTVLLLLAVCMALANGINLLFTSGFSAWHINFLPENVRASFFTYQQVAHGIVAAVGLLLSGYIFSNAQKSGNMMSFFVVLRIIIFAICIVEVILYSLPKEYPYEQQSGKTALLAMGSVFTKQKEYIAVMGLVFLWNFTAILPATAMDVHLLQNIKIPYMLVTGMTASFSVFLLVLAPVWKRLIRSHGWLRSFALATFLYTPFSAALGFLTPRNYAWLYPLARCFQLALFVGITITYANMAYLALKEQNQTACLSLFLLLSNLGAFAGQTLGTTLVSSLRGMQIQLFSTNFGVVTVLMLLQAAGMTAMGFYSLWLKKYLKRTHNINA